jgi:hypothetical protein
MDGMHKQVEPVGSHQGADIHALCWKSPLKLPLFLAQLAVVE